MVNTSIVFAALELAEHFTVDFEALLKLGLKE